MLRCVAPSMPFTNVTPFYANLTLKGAIFNQLPSSLYRHIPTSFAYLPTYTIVTKVKLQVKAKEIYVGDSENLPSNYLCSGWNRFPPTDSRFKNNKGVEWGHCDLMLYWYN